MRNILLDLVSNCVFRKGFTKFLRMVSKTNIAVLIIEWRSTYGNRGWVLCEPGGLPR